jgi:Uma2 family endonuclease
MAMLSHPATYDDLQRLRDTSDEFIELIEGALVVTPSPTPLHQFVSQRLYDLLKSAVADTGLGLVSYAPLDVRLDEETVLQPDLIVLLGDRVELIGDVSVDGPPSLVIEIDSPSTSARDRMTKREIYARHGIPEYWIVDPDARRVTVLFDPRDGRYHAEMVSTDFARSVVIPGLIADLAVLFAPIRGA